MKRIFCTAIAIITFLSVRCVPTVFADTSDAFIIADFSNGSAGLDLTASRQWMGKAPSFNYRWSNDDYSDEKTRVGKENSLKWDKMYVEPQGSDGTYTAHNTYLQTPVLDNITLGQLIEYKYMNAWVYSDTVTPQKIQFNIADRGIDGTGSGTNNGNNYYKAIGEINWTGWKLVSVSIADLTIPGFSRPGAGHTASADDKVFFSIRAASNGIKGLSTESLLYVDSFWLSKTDPKAFDTSENLKITPSIVNGSTDISTQTKSLTFTANREFKFGKDYYSSLVTVTRNGASLSEGVDYTVQQEFDKLYVIFNNVFADKDEITVEISEGAEMNDGSAIPATAVTFETGIAELEFDGYEFSLVGENGETAITQPPASGTVRVSARVKNITDSTVSPIIFVGVYDKTTNEMKKIESGSVSGGIGANETETIFAEVSADSYSNCYIRAFIWDSETGMYSYGASGEI